MKRLINEGSWFVSGAEDSTTINFAPDGSFINHRQSVTLLVRDSDHTIPVLCWILLIVLLLAIVTSIIVICCVGFRTSFRGKRKETSRIASHCNGFAPAPHPVGSSDMMPKFVASPAQSYSTQKLYQWCQQKEMQQYKSLWAVNPSIGKDHSTIHLHCAITVSILAPSASIVHIPEKNENPNAYKTRSLPSKNKQRPVSSIEDLDELYSKVNFSKKLRNRMTNDEAAIIAFCRSKSQNLSQFSGSGPKGDDAIVIYDERTAL